MAEVDKEVAKFVIKELVEATIDVAHNLFGVDLKTGGVEKVEGNTVRTSGAVVVVGFAGMFSGRILLSLPKKFAYDVCQILLDKTPDEMDVLFTVAEFGNLVSGNALTKVNNAMRGANLRLTPPSAFLGDEVVMSNVKLSNFNVNLPVVGRESDVLKLNVAFST